jgi:hypothetical protein
MLVGTAVEMNASLSPAVSQLISRALNVQASPYTSKIISLLSLHINDWVSNLRSPIPQCQR